MEKYFTKNGECYMWIFRAWSRTIKGKKFFPKKKKALRILVKVDCSFCGVCP